MAETKSTGGLHNREYEITVGHAKADLVGCDGRAIQLAIDALAQRGGGTVRVLPGEYLLQDSVRLRSNIALCGERDKTILRRGPLVWSPLALDADIGQQEITPADASAFRPGMSICLWDEREGWALSETQPPYFLTGVDHGVLRLNHYLTSERHAAAGGRVVNYFPLILGYSADNVVVDGFTLDAAVDDPQGVLAGMRTAAIYFAHCQGGTIRNVVARNVLGDGICCGKGSLHSTVEDCEMHHNTFHGMHPGSHSAYFTLRRCDLHHNGADGLYVCWGVRHGLFEGNTIHHNGFGLLRSGLSIGHKDTDNLLVGNHIYENCKFGICVRTKTAGNGAHRNTWRNNIIENNGSPPEVLAELKAKREPWEREGCGVDIRGVTQDNVFENNTIRETRSGAARTQLYGLRLAPGVSGTIIRGNTITGHPREAVCDESGDPSNRVE